MGTSLIVRSINEITGTDRDVNTPNWRSKRIILAGDGSGGVGLGRPPPTPSTADFRSVRWPVNLRSYAESADRLYASFAEIRTQSKTARRAAAPRSGP